MRSFIVCILAAFLAGCSDLQTNTKYDVLWRGVTLDEKKLGELQKQLPESISLERPPDMIGAGDYRVTFHRDGTAELDGSASMPFQGKYIAEIDPVTYTRLCCLMERLRFHTLRREYRSGGTDMPAFIVTVSLNGKQHTVLSEYGCGPVEFWAIEQMIHSIAESLLWETVSPRQPAVRGQSIFRKNTAGGSL